ncbi:citrate lyase holo-[acyl-carrier protein] synthase [Irregularibacter muris]|uniref:citrate lyase holo-[acyl-carrier protein] synthase n=1 Tax=Irregularibacter muris TaxID=1796619 RepID=A0AAE3HHT1_9FIRM|nr:citrate lyase holo-[acyl-carrier protein] synthase [Irregularibacter muris]MCR1898823.1 citrate lyase holo-[acyl-carrier protein] synthase [Irregularibacter muris]
MNSSRQSIINIIESREKRVIHQRKLLQQYQKNTLVSYKINIPGEIKDSPLYRKIFKKGWEELIKQAEDKSIEILSKEEFYKASGPEGYMVFKEEATTIKKLTTNIEEQHPLGRIFDFDVLYGEGKQISRTDIGKSPRRCFICDGNAFECGRSRRHSIEELVASIHDKAQTYFENEK